MVVVVGHNTRDGSGGDGNASTICVNNEPEWMLSWEVSGFGLDTQLDGSNGDECAGGSCVLGKASLQMVGDSEIGGDGDGVVMARSLSTSASGGRDMEA
ncbi:hypothetical protein Tco_0653325 [Tanacetum coccineum]|uniref:Uncharacterized protein n=1 Tax=Tanacetum coccineum TaxID=301880 RepID=A0ABQ4X022_9ASTR